MAAAEQTPGIINAERLSFRLSADYTLSDRSGEKIYPEKKNAIAHKAPRAARRIVSPTTIIVAHPECKKSMGERTYSLFALSAHTRDAHTQNTQTD